MIKKIMARLRKKRKKQSKGIIKTSVLKIVVLLVIVGLNWTGLLAVGKTFAFFSNTGDSSANTFTAGILDFSLRSGQNNFVSPAENMKPGDSTARDIYINKLPNSLPLKHSVSYNFINGNEDFCDQLQLKIWYNHYFGPPGDGYANRDMRLKYDGPLTSLVNLTDVDFIIPHLDDQFDTNPGDGTEQWFYYSIIMPGGIDDLYQGESCHFKFVYKGWQDNVANYGDGGFTDIEEIENTIKAGYWNPPVVLNEFLPNARNYPEFIELYNKTASPIDLNGFYIKANGNTIPINTVTTDAYSGGSTVIPANSWLVVTADGDLINDSSGKITLYNPNDVEVDSYTYDASDYNVNNTPGWTNDLVGYWPFDGDLEDKSGNGNDGTNYGATSVSGKINQALSFDGVDDYISIANSDDFDFGSGEFSVEFWTKTNSSSRQWVGTRYENYGPGWGLGTQNSHTLGYIRTLESGTGKTEVEGTVDVANNNWHHIVMVRIGDKIKIYTDGVFEKEGTLAGDVDNNEPIEIGRISWSGGSQYFEGLIDEVKIYNRALNATEISEHYNDVSIPLGVVPLDKSYARIPDGSDNWVDPIPTPGAPNILESEIINQEEPIAEELPVEETPVAEEEPISDATEEPVVEGEPIVEEEPAEEIPVIEEESIEEEVTTEENPFTEEEPAIVEESAGEEAPVVEEQPIVVPDDSSPTQGSTGESGSDSAGDTAGDTGDAISE